VTEASVARMDKNFLVHEHWVEVATMPLPARELTFEFFELSLEDGFVHAVCGSGAGRAARSHRRPLRITSPH
jgi:hypothetical protein